jgi:hypothetical protein
MALSASMVTSTQAFVQWFNQAKIGILVANRKTAAGESADYPIMFQGNNSLFQPHEKLVANLKMIKEIACGENIEE